MRYRITAIGAVEMALGIAKSEESNSLDFGTRLNCPSWIVFGNLASGSSGFVFHSEFTFQAKFAGGRFTCFAVEAEECRHRL